MYYRFLLFLLCISCSHSKEYVIASISTEYKVNTENHIDNRIDEEDKDIIGFHLNIPVERFEEICKKKNGSYSISSDNKFVRCSANQAILFLKVERLIIRAISGSIINDRVAVISLNIFLVNTDYKEAIYQFTNRFGIPTEIDDNGLDLCQEEKKIHPEKYDMKDLEKIFKWEQDKSFIIYTYISCNNYFGTMFSSYYDFNVQFTSVY